MDNNSAATIPTSDSNLLLECGNVIKDKSSSTDIVSTKVIFADRETLRRSAGNKHYREKRQMKLLLSVIRKVRLVHKSLFCTKNYFVGHHALLTRIYASVGLKLGDTLSIYLQQKGKDKSLRHDARRLVKYKTN